jgi:hypothetical protein
MVSAMSLDFGNNVLQFRFRSGYHNDSGARRGELEGGGFSNAFPSTCHDGNLA